LEELAKNQHEDVDVPDTAPPADVTEQGLPEKAAPPSPKVPAKSGEPHGTPGAPLPRGALPQ
ncbi:MAG: hypothetical protein ACRD4H_03405, partial [Candidatus Acidiferrales bacterium]